MTNKINFLVVVGCVLAISGGEAVYGQIKHNGVGTDKNTENVTVLKSKAGEWLNKENQSVRFTENKGQVVDQNYTPRPDVLFIANTLGEQYIVTPKGTSHQLVKPEKASHVSGDGNKPMSMKETKGSVDFYRVDMEWLNCNPHPIVEKTKSISGYTNYYNLPQAENGITKVEDFEQVVLKDIYKGIDVKFYGAGSLIEYDYVVVQGADYKQIRIKIDGTDAHLNTEGELVLNTPLGKITESAPKVFQAGRQLLASWKQLGETEWGFDIQDYNPQLAMVIDPVSRAWGTYYGGNIEDFGNVCSVDDDGSVYLAGRTWSTNNIATSGSHQSSISSDYDAYIVKFNSSGVRQWATYYGGPGNDMGNSLTVDHNGGIYLAGMAPSISGISTAGAHQSAFGGGSADAYLVKFNTSGIRLWGTYYGGDAYDEGNYCSVDTSGNIYLAGNSFSATGIATVGSHQGVYNSVIGNNAFLAKFNSSGVLQWGTYYNGNNTVYANACTADLSGNVYLGGYTQSTIDIATLGSHQSAYTGSNDAFLIKFNGNGVRQWGTYFGGTMDDRVLSCAADLNGNIYISGQTSSTSGIVTTGAHQTTFGYIYLAKFDSMGVQAWGTYYGANTSGRGYSCTTDASGNVYLAGETNSSTNIASVGAHQTTISIGADAFIAKFNSGGVRDWGTYYGGQSLDNGYSCAVGPGGDIYLAGTTRSTNNISSTGAHQTVFGSSSVSHPDAFLAKFTDCDQFNIVTNVTTNSPVCNGGTLELNSNVTGGTGPYTYSWNAGFGEISTDSSATYGVFVGLPGDFTLTVTDENGCEKIDTIPVSVYYNMVVTTDSIVSVCEGDDINFIANVAGGTAPFLYSWSGTTPFTSSQQNPVVPNATSFYSGNYSIEVTDANGCFRHNYVDVTVHPNPIATISSTNNTKCSGSCNGTAIVSVTGGTIPYTYLWNNGQTTDTAFALCNGNFGVIATDVNGCKTDSSIVVVNTSSDVNPEVYLTNLAAIDQINVSPSFAAYYTYNLPATITANTSNPRNFVDPGKKARFKVECTNQKTNGQSIVSGICKVRSNNPYITITDSSSALNNIGWNNNAWSADEFEIDIAANTPPGTNAYIDFVVQESGQNYATTCIAIPITPLVYSPTTPLTIDDDSNPDSQGNDNDICEPGETIEFYPWLNNISTLDAEYVRGRFENLDNHSFINIWNGVPGVGTTVYDATWWNYGFAMPQTINASANNTTPEYDFVFDFDSSSISTTDFKLYMVMAGGFKLFSGTALSLVQWTLPYTFNNTTTTSIDANKRNNEVLSMFPNPANDKVKFAITNKNIEKLAIYNQVGVLIYQADGSTDELDVSGFSKGVYLIRVYSDNKIINKKLVIR